ncbi:MAG TPA: hypothetical protein GXZ23_07790 [Clostridiales bacterium]|jgi:hypothetical protein|nr:hypothetical protein [Clostridiales bacterium]
MKTFNKIIALILSIIMIGSAACMIAVAENGEEEATTAVEETSTETVEEETTKIHVSSWRQLQFAIIFKLFDKIMKFFQDLFSGQRTIDFGALFG